jgi:hypothetical protein
MYKCDNCGSSNVEQKCWVDLNVKPIEDSIRWGSQNELDENWCGDCVDHTTVSWKEEEST